MLRYFLGDTMENTEQGFGNLLQKKRESLGLSIRQVSISIKMTPNMIQDIENENFGNLPQAVFLRGLIRTYCKHLNLDEKQILENFDAVTKFEKQVTKRSHIDDSQGQIKTPTYVILSRIFIPIFILCILGATATVIVFITRKYEKETSNLMGFTSSKTSEVSETPKATPESNTEEQSNTTSSTESKVESTVEPTIKPTATTKSTEAQSVTAATVQAPTTAAVSPVAEKKITQVITLEPLAKTLVTVKIDDTDSQKIILRPDSNKTFQGVSKINLKIQDGGAVNIIHNNKDIGVPGVFGQEIELNFPKN
jgi:cytoskeleton protein RodZ